MAADDHTNRGPAGRYRPDHGQTRAPLFLAPAVLLGYGFGALAVVWWEIMEWGVSEDGFGGAGGLALTYSDTVGDLLLSSTGGLVGSVLGVLCLGPSGGRVSGGA